ncbi:uncharacterized protein K452DRAFT_301076 [Aplosporella prunicola CBS 121167]|uniref:Uncharacterized protein n=1 Tax=Aplosporella prunicola CBS 121167 TaxID=1176127 RepID=A0A6A6B3B3_9PEZI|nr:uncharacterized protein K452DRAFT_301076 [Aplosporella prunicola CBS 121167]KAF2138540.1 hypothetical protein K452DRAFT_301076 [Aplosporella prunicola CBS 121167]
MSINVYLSHTNDALFPDGAVDSDWTEIFKEEEAQLCRDANLDVKRALAMNVPSVVAIEKKQKDQDKRVVDLENYSRKSDERIGSLLKQINSLRDEVESNSTIAFEAIESATYQKMVLDKFDMIGDDKQDLNNFRGGQGRDIRALRVRANGVPSLKRKFDDLKKQ